ncbi:MAG: diacylglycerol/polyprenol kinase family protein [Planctomycetaceae bacterium]
MLARKAYHISGAIIPAVYASTGIPRAVVAGILGGLALLLLAADFGRRLSSRFDALFRASFRAILDPKDFIGVNGSTLYFAGCALAAALFPKAIACAAILSLALGDPLAALIGTSVRSPRFGRVSLAGSLACLCAATASCAFFVGWPRALLGGVAATLAEALSGSKLDNLTLPLAVAAALRLL